MLLGVGIETALAQTNAQNRLTVSSIQALQTVLNSNPSTFATEIELDRDNGVLVYGVELNNGRDVKVNANNGQIIRVDRDDDRQRNAPKVPMRQAIQTVLTNNPGTFVKEAKLEREDGVLRYEVELNNNRDVNVNANNGQIISVDNDD